MHLILTLLLACGAEPIDTSDSDTTVTEGATQPAGCDLVEVGYDGPEAPILGDIWTVWPVCDGATVFGATVIRVDPATCGSLAENVVTWVETGTCTLMAQTGSQRAYLDVIITEAR